VRGTLSMVLVVLCASACGKRIDAPPVPELIEQLQSPDSDVQLRAIFGLMEHGPAAVPAIPAIQSFIDTNAERDNGVFRWGCELLSRIGPAAIPAFRDLIRHRNRYVRSACASHVGTLAENYPETVDEVLALLNTAAIDPEENVRDLSVFGFESVARKHKLTRSVPVLVPLLLEGGDLTGRVANLLGYNVGPEAKGAVPQLIQYLDDEREEVRYGTVWVLGMIGPDARAAAPSLRKLLEDPSQSVRDHAVAALQKIESPSVPN
jgi:HEAT repeat protein